MPIEINTDNIADAVADRLGDIVGTIGPRLLTLDQGATYLGLTKDALKAKVSMGSIPPVDLDLKLRFDREDFDRIIERTDGAHKMSRTRVIVGQGSIYLRRLLVVQLCRWRSEKAGILQDKSREEALAFLQRRQGKLASGEHLTPERTRVRDLFQVLLEEYMRGKLKRTLQTSKSSRSQPILGDTEGPKSKSAQVKTRLRS